MYSLPAKAPQRLRGTPAVDGVCPLNGATQFGSSTLNVGTCHAVAASVDDPCLMINRAELPEQSPSAALRCRSNHYARMIFVRFSQVETGGTRDSVWQALSDPNAHFIGLGPDFYGTAAAPNTRNAPTSANSKHSATG